MDCGRAAGNEFRKLLVRPPMSAPVMGSIASVRVNSPSV
jgi:hypothetical protein